VTNRAAAMRYARALFDVAKAQADPQQIEQELAAFVALFDEHPALKAVMLNPAVPAARKRTAINDVAGRVALSPILTKLVLMLAERDRLVLLPDMLDAYRDRLMSHLQILRAEVTTAIPLDGDKTARIEQSLAAVTGRRVAMTTRVDPQIIGGVVATIGSTVYDGSVATQLQKMKARLTDGG
jgi:F-type H+-transporting ATPase subunit delta